MKEFNVGDRVRFIGDGDGYIFKDKEKARGVVSGFEIEGGVFVLIDNDTKFDPEHRYFFRYNMIKKSSCIADFIRRFWRIN